MAYRVVCISGADGAEGGEVAEIVARELGFRLVNEHVIIRAAREAGVEPHVVADVELRQSFVARLLASLTVSGSEAAAAFGGGFVPSGREDSLTDESMRALIRAAIEEIAAEGDAVIFAHAASIALANRDDVLRVLVTAGVETRAKRLVAAGQIDEKVTAKAIRESDTARAVYLGQFYGIERELPTHYDLVLNTDRLTAGQAAMLVVEAARSSS